MSQDNNQQPVFEIDADNSASGFFNLPEVEDMEGEGTEFEYQNDPEPIAESEDEETNTNNTEELSEGNQDTSEEDGEEDEEEEQPEEEEEPEGDSEGDNDRQDNPLEGFSEAAIVAEHLKSINFLDTETEVNKESDYNELVQVLVSQSEKVARQNIDAELRQKGWTDDNLKYAQFLAQGGSPGAISQVSALEQLANIDISDDENETNREQVVKAMYKAKGIDPDEATVFIDALKDEGKLETKAQSAKTFFETERNKYNKQIQDAADARNEQIRQAEENRVNHFSQLIDKGELGVVTIDDSEKQLLKDSLFKKTEIVKVKDPNGGYTTTFVTKFDKLYNELQSDPVQQLIFAKMLLNGFDTSDVAKKAEAQATESVLDLLNRKKQSNKQSRKKSSKPKYKNAYIGQ